MVAPLFGGVFAGRRVLITGHTGFKGSWLSHWLLRMDAEITGYALEPPTDPSLFEELGLVSRTTHHIGDIRDLAHLTEVVEDARPEMVFHMAAQPLVRRSYDVPVETYETNVMGTVNALEAVRSARGVRVFIGVTSDKCYENRETGQAYREIDPMGGHDPYSSSKACSELVIGAYRRSFFGERPEPAAASVRAGNVIGGGDWALDRVVPDCIRALEANRPIVIRRPEAVRPWQHVLEPLAGYLHLASRMWSHGHAFDGPWNFGPASQGTITVAQVADEVVRAWGSGSWVAEPDTGSVHEAHLLALDITKARNELGWRPLLSIDRAVEMTATWYRRRAQGGDARVLVDGDIDAYVAEARAADCVWTAPPVDPAGRKE